MQIFQPFKSKLRLNGEQRRLMLTRRANCGDWFWIGIVFAVVGLAVFALQAVGS